MRRYAFSKFRIGVLVALFGAAVFVLARTSMAQSSPGGTTTVTTTTDVPHPGPFAIVMENWKDMVFWIILALSIAGLTLIIQGVITNRASVFMPEETTDTIREMITQRKFKELIDFTETDPSFISKALNPALKRAPSFSSMKEAMETAIGEQTAEQFRKIEYLNIIGNLGPLLGLLGTVLGMINAFEAMNAAGASGAGASQLAGGISQALCHTMLGLILAIPCLAAFGVLRTVVDRLTVRGAMVAEELLLMIKPAEAKPAAAGVLRPGAVPQPGPRKAPTPAPNPPPLPAQA